jgi:hypothetical protein
MEQEEEEEVEEEEAEEEREVEREYTIPATAPRSMLSPTASLSPPSSSSSSPSFPCASPLLLSPISSSSSSSLSVTSPSNKSSVLFNRPRLVTVEMRVSSFCIFAFERKKFDFLHFRRDRLTLWRKWKTLSLRLRPTSHHLPRCRTTLSLPHPHPLLLLYRILPLPPPSSTLTSQEDIGSHPIGVL